MMFKEIKITLDTTSGWHRFSKEDASKHLLKSKEEADQFQMSKIWEVFTGNWTIIGKLHHGQQQIIVVTGRLVTTT